MHARSSSCARAISQSGALCITSDQLYSDRKERHSTRYLAVYLLQQYTVTEREWDLDTLKRKIKAKKIRPRLLRRWRRCLYLLAACRVQVQVQAHARLHRGRVQPVPEALAIFSVCGRDR